jgi:hypothetical protein
MGQVENDSQYQHRVRERLPYLVRDARALPGLARIGRVRQMPQEPARSDERPRAGGS